MANRSYLYTLSNQPTEYADRPQRITGLTEWNYHVPFGIFLLLSGDPVATRSLIAPGLSGDDFSDPTRLHALNAPVAPGLRRLERLVEVLDVAAEDVPKLREAGRETLEFLTAHVDEYFQLETVELEIMDSETQDEFDAHRDENLAAARATGAAVDALPTDTEEAARTLIKAVESGEGTFATLRGLTLSSEFDRTTPALGLSYWATNLYWDLANKAQFDAAANR